jgi:hypothetical protein
MGVLQLRERRRRGVARRGCHGQYARLFGAGSATRYDEFIICT